MSTDAAMPPPTDIVTLTRHVLDNQYKLGDAASGDLTLLLTALQTTCKYIASSVRKARLINLIGLAGEQNASGESQKRLDVISDQIMVNALRASGKTAILISEEQEEAIFVGEGGAGGTEKRLKGPYVVCFDPLDGSSNIDAGVNVGTIFSIFKVQSGEPSLKDVLRKGSDIVAAGYTMYGSSTVMMLTTGNGVNGFTLDDALGEFILTHVDVKLPERGTVYSINEGNSKYYDQPTLKWLESVKFPAGDEKPRTARYIGSMVADVHRTLLYGGIFGYPADSKSKKGKLRYLYEAAPMAYLVEQAGGLATDGRQRILDILPEHIHDRTGIFLGSKADVQDVIDFYKKY